MKVKDKIILPLFSLEYMSNDNGVILLRKKHKKVIQDIYIKQQYLSALLGKLKGESK